MTNCELKDVSNTHKHVNLDAVMILTEQWVHRLHHHDRIQGHTNPHKLRSSQESNHTLSGHARRPVAISIRLTAYHLLVSSVSDSLLSGSLDSASGHNTQTGSAGDSVLLSVLQFLFMCGCACKILQTLSALLFGMYILCRGHTRLTVLLF